MIQTHSKLYNRAALKLKRIAKEARAFANLFQPGLSGLDAEDADDRIVMDLGMNLSLRMKQEIEGLTLAIPSPVSLGIAAFKNKTKEGVFV